MRHKGLTTAQLRQLAAIERARQDIPPLERAAQGICAAITSGGCGCAVAGTARSCHAMLCAARRAARVFGVEAGDARATQQVY